GGLPPAPRPALAPFRAAPAGRRGPARRPRLRPQPLPRPDRASTNDGGSPAGELPAAPLTTRELGLAAWGSARGRHQPLGWSGFAGSPKRREGDRGDRSGSVRRAPRPRSAAGPMGGRPPVPFAPDVSRTRAARSRR